MSGTGALWGRDELDHDYDARRSERERDASRKRDDRREAREVEIRPVKDPARREACRLDLRRFMLTYFPTLFYMDLSVVHDEIVAAVQAYILGGGRIALAAPRGYGKTTLLRVAVIWAIVYGHARFVVPVCSEWSMGLVWLREIKRLLASERGPFAEDFPDVVCPVVALEGAPQRAGMQLHEGKLTGLLWGSAEIRLAAIEGSAASGAIVRAASLEGSIRGLLVGDMRPDLVLVDDAQTRESAHSQTLTVARWEVMKGDLEGLVGPGHALTIVSLWTIIARWEGQDAAGEAFHGDLAWRFLSDQEPSYRSMRYRALDGEAANPALVEEYIARRKAAQVAGDLAARAAHAWYLLRQDEVEAGLVAAWAQNFVVAPISDLDWEACPAEDEAVVACRARGWEGRLRQTEVSAVQAQLNRRATLGDAAYAAEYLNDPPLPEVAQVARIDPDAVLGAVHGLERGVVPDGAVAVVEGRDVGRHWLHWVAAAILPGRRVCIIDYGADRVDSPDGRVEPSAEGQRLQAAIELAVLAALRARNAQERDTPYRDAAGTPYPIRVALSDSRYGRNIVRRFCLEAGGPEFAVLGMGSNKKSTREAWRPIPKGTPAANVARDGHIYTKGERPRPVFYAHADAFKAQVHAGFLLPLAAAGSISLFAPAAINEHAEYAAQVTAEQEVAISAQITTWRPTPGRRANHYLDATYYCLAAASILESAFPEARLEADPEAVRIRAEAPVDTTARTEPERMRDPRLRGAAAEASLRRKRKARIVEI